MVGNFLCIPGTVIKLAGGYLNHQSAVFFFNSSIYQYIRTYVRTDLWYRYFIFFHFSVFITVELLLTFFCLFPCFILGFRCLCLPSCIFFLSLLVTGNGRISSLPCRIVCCALMRVTTCTYRWPSWIACFSIWFSCSDFILFLCVLSVLHNWPVIAPTVGFL